METNSGSRARLLIGKLLGTHGPDPGAAAPVGAKGAPETPTAAVGVPESLGRWNGNPGTQVGSQVSASARWAQVRSWHLASGLFWIMNVLIELDLYAYCPPIGHWADVASGKVLRDSHFQRFHATPFPRVGALARQAGSVATDLVVDCCHAMPVLGAAPVPTIIWYRNLYGAMYSDYARYSDRSQSFVAWFRSPHFNGLPISKLDSWALYYALWLNLSQGPRVISASFDFCRMNPVEGMRRILAALGAERDERTILDACNASRADRIVDSNRAGMEKYKFRSGSPSEYSTHLTDDDIAMVVGAPRIVMDHLSGHGGADVGGVPDGHLMTLVQRAAGADVPGPVGDALHQQDLIGVSHLCRTNFRDNPASQLIGLALRITLMLCSNTVLDTQEMFVPAESMRAFRTTLFCLSQAAVPELVRSFATREAARSPLLHERLG